MLKNYKKRQKDCPGAPGSASGRPKLTSRCLRKRKQRVFVARLARTLFSNRLFDNFWQKLFFCEVCKPSKVPRLSIKSRVRPFALRVTSLERCCLENHEN